MIGINSIYNIKENRVHSNAEARFINSCGIKIGDPNKSKKFQKMLDMGLATRESGIGGIDINLVTSFYGPEVFEDGHIRIGDADVYCNFFTQIPKDNILGMYVYMMTVGECLFKSEDEIMEFLFADIWGNSYCDAAIQAFKEDIIIPDMKERFETGVFEGADEESGGFTNPGAYGQSADGVHLSSEYGPGYFGMNVRYTKEFGKFMDSASIGIRIKDTGMMIPQKSVTGLFFVTKQKIVEEPACMRCLGNSKGCEFCEIRMRTENIK